METEEELFNELLKKDPNPGIPGRLIVKNGKATIPGWIINKPDIDSITILNCNIPKDTGFSSQLVYDILQLGLTDVNNRPKCWICNKSAMFLSLAKGYGKGCTESHSKTAMKIKINDIKDIISQYPNKPLATIWAIKKIKNKFGDKIELLSNYENSFKKLQLFCHEKDPITGIEHGKFEKSLNNLVNSTECHGCNECSILKSRGKWKLTFFEDIKKLYPNQDFDFIGVKDRTIKFPKNKDKLLFKCKKCKTEFSLTPDQILYHKPIHHECEINYLCPKCGKNKPIKYTKDMCTIAARKCKSRSEFQNKYPGEYAASHRYDWIDEFNWLKTPEKLAKDIDENDRSYYVYIYDFSPFGNREIYVGITCESNKENRKSKHRELRISERTGKDISSPIRKISIKYGLNLDNHEEEKYLKYIESGLNATEAQEREDYYKNKYIKEGYIVLNKGKTGIGSGSLGGAIKKWDSLDKCIKAVLDYKNEGHTYQETLSHLNAPMKKIIKAGKLDEVWPERKKNYTEDTYKQACLDCKQTGNKKQKVSLQTAYRRGRKSNQSELQVKFEKIYKSIFPTSIYDSTAKRTIQMSSDRLSMIKIFDSLKNAAEETKINRSNIGGVLNKRQKTAGGFFWIYENDFLNDYIPELKKTDPKLAEDLMKQYETLKQNS